MKSWCHGIRSVALLACLGLALSVSAPSSILRAQMAPGASAQASSRVDVLIGFRSTPTRADEALVRSAGGQVRHRYHLVPAIAASLPERAAAALLANPRVTVIEPDGEVFAIHHDAELDNTWGVKHIGAGLVHHGAGELPSLEGGGVAVAVIDSGIDYTHPELAGHYGGGYDFVNNDTDPMDDNGHGTHVAGTVGAARNGAGVVGVAPSATLVALKVLSAGGSGNWSDVIAALQWTVDNGIRITNNSYGSGGNPGTTVQAAFDNSAALGVLHIAAAGNNGNCGGRGNSVGYPARFSSVIAVAATNQNDTRPCFSSTGPDVELAAPGVSIRSTVPGGGHAVWNGTSMASPHVAGTAALVMNAGAYTAAEVRSILTSTARNLGNANHYGHGLVQAAAAVAAAAGEGGGSGGGGEDPGDDPEPPPANGTVSVTSVTYSGSGGPNQNRHLSVTVAVADGTGTAVSGAAVGVSVLNTTTGASAAGTGTTGSGGTVSFTWNNAPAGCYETTVTQVTANGLSWNGTTPSNFHCK